MDFHWSFPANLLVSVTSSVSSCRASRKIAKKSFHKELNQNLLYSEHVMAQVSQNSLQRLEKLQACEPSVLGFITSLTYA